MSFWSDICLGFAPAPKAPKKLVKANTLTGTEFAKMDLLKSWYAQTLDGGLYRVEVRRDPASGLTLKGTFQQD